MKIFSIFLLCYFAIALASCTKEQQVSEGSNYKYEATVLSPGDCGPTFQIDLKNLGPRPIFEDGIYYAGQLDSIYKIPGLHIYLNCRSLNDTEIYACSALGFAYPHLVVIESVSSGE